MGVTLTEDTRQRDDVSERNRLGTRICNVSMALRTGGSLVDPPSDLFGETIAYPPGH